VKGRVLQRGVLKRKKEFRAVIKLSLASTLHEDSKEFAEYFETCQLLPTPALCVLMACLYCAVVPLRR